MVKEYIYFSIQISYILDLELPNYVQNKGYVCPSLFATLSDSMCCFVDLLQFAMGSGQRRQDVSNLSGTETTPIRHEPAPCQSGFGAHSLCLY